MWGPVMIAVPRTLDGFTGNMIRIDGSMGEGGGQILRSSLALSLMTREPVSITNIRARRDRPGLMPQHLKAAHAAAEVGGARMEGASAGSLSLTFIPGAMRHGEFHFDIGTAGAASLVLQTVAIPLCFAGAPSRVTVVGGTHVPKSPCYHYLDLHWRRCLKAAGFDIRLAMPYAGFYPKGGGTIEASIIPAARISPLRLTRRGRLTEIHGISAVAQLDPNIARRQRARALTRLEQRRVPVRIEVVDMPARSPGTMLLLSGEFEHARCCFFALGARGKPAERVADEAVDKLEEFLAAGGAVDPYLTDQLLLPLAFADGTSRLATSAISSHLLTSAAVIKKFLRVDIAVSGEEGRPGLIEIAGTGRRRAPRRPRNEHR